MNVNRPMFEALRKGCLLGLITAVTFLSLGCGVGSDSDNDSESTTEIQRIFDGKIPIPSLNLIRNRALPIDLCDCSEHFIIGREKARLFHFHEKAFGVKSDRLGDLKGDLGRLLPSALVVGRTWPRCLMGSVQGALPSYPRPSYSCGAWPSK